MTEKARYRPQWKRIVLEAFIVVSLTAVLTDIPAASAALAGISVRKESPPIGGLSVVADASMTGAPIYPGTPMRILPLGDSITQSFRNHRSYRYNLWVKLINAGIDFKFVGSMHSNAGGNPLWPPYRGRSFNNTHEGHSGWTTGQILNGFPGHGQGRLTTWLQGYTPDVVLLLLGTNDAFQDENISSVEDNLKQIIFELRVRNPNVIILLAKLIPTSYPNFNSRIDALNAAIGGIAPEMNMRASPVIVVDQLAGFDPETDTFDGVHPNELGEEKMAQKWFQAIKALLDQGIYPPERTRGAAKDSGKQTGSRESGIGFVDCETGVGFEGTNSFAQCGRACPSAPTNSNPQAVRMENPRASEGLHFLLN